MLIDLMAGSMFRMYKVMVNEFLSNWTMEENFISVKPKGNKDNGVSTTSINEHCQTLTRLYDNHPVGLFLQGAVQTLSLRQRCCRDCEWQESVVILIQKANVPIVPLFFDQNSPFFYSLGINSMESSSDKEDDERSSYKSDFTHFWRWLK